MLNRYSGYDRRTGFIEIRSGAFHDCALHKEGFVLCTGANSFGQCETDLWTEVLYIECGDYHSIGFDGKRVLSTGSNKFGQCNVPKKRGVKQIACGSNHTVILYKNGCLRAVGDNSSGQCDVNSLKHIRKILAIKDLTIAIDNMGNTYMRGNIPIYFNDYQISENVNDIFICNEYAIIQLSSKEIEVIGKAPHEFKRHLNSVLDKCDTKKIICVSNALLLITESGKAHFYTEEGFLDISPKEIVTDAVLFKECQDETHIYYITEDGEIRRKALRHGKEILWMEQL